MTKHTYRRRFRSVATRALLAVVLLVGIGGLALAGSSYSYTHVGDVNAPTPDKTSGAILMVGGGPEFKSAFRWFVKQAGHGHIVILREHDGTLQRWLWNKVHGMTSVQTIVFHSRKAASDPRVLAIVRNADAIYFAGGDQSKYVRYWKGTPLNKALNQLVREGKPFGGNSAGLAILGQWSYGALDGGSVTSPEALDDPDGSKLTIVSNFLQLPLLGGVITDTHFAQRDRLGRLLAFVARIAKDQHTGWVTGLGVDQGCALLINADGTARLEGRHPGCHAWIVAPQKLRAVEKKGGKAALKEYLATRVAPGEPMNVPGFVVVGLGTKSGLQVKNWAITKPAFFESIDVKDGKMYVRSARGHYPGADK